jgi:hypothetical protein
MNCDILDVCFIYSQVVLFQLPNHSRASQPALKIFFDLLTLERDETKHAAAAMPAAMMMMCMNDSANAGKLMLWANICFYHSISQTDTLPLKLKHTSLSRHLQSLQFNAINAAFTGANVPRSQFWLARLLTRWPLALGDAALLAPFT